MKKVIFLSAIAMLAGGSLSAQSTKSSQITKEVKTVDAKSAVKVDRKEMAAPVALKSEKQIQVLKMKIREEESQTIKTEPQKK